MPFAALMKLLASSSGDLVNIPVLLSPHAFDLILFLLVSFWVFILQTIQQLPGRSPHAQSTAGALPLSAFSVDGALDIFKTLAVDLDTEGRYLFLNAIANQLRYPNTHTHYFSFILLYLFYEANQVNTLPDQLFCVKLNRVQCCGQNAHGRTIISYDIFLIIKVTPWF